jgi:hypothetical protein
LAAVFFSLIKLVLNPPLGLCVCRCNYHMRKTRIAAFADVGQGIRLAGFDFDGEALAAFFRDEVEGFF